MSFRFCFIAKLITEDELNKRIENFQYGYLHVSKKPSRISMNKVKNSNRVGQHAYQALLLMQVLPCLIYDKLELLSDKEKLKSIQDLVTCHLNILCIIMSTTIDKATAERLEQYTIQHNLLFISVFPEAAKINKLHHLLHYSLCILYSGPCRFYNTARFEAKHQLFKTKSSVNHNFKNLTHTLSLCNSFELLFNLAYNETYTFHISEKINVDACVNNFQRINTVEPFQIFKSIQYYSIKYKHGSFVCLENDDKPVFGKIIEMAMQNNKLLFYVEKLNTIKFSEKYFGYEVSSLNEKQFAEYFFEELPIKDPFVSWKVINSDIQIIFKSTLILDY